VPRASLGCGRIEDRVPPPCKGSVFNRLGWLIVIRRQATAARAKILMVSASRAGASQSTSKPLIVIAHVPDIWEQWAKARHTARNQAKNNRAICSGRTEK
jgi:hypothetical protein